MIKGEKPVPNNFAPFGKKLLAYLPILEMIQKAVLLIGRSGEIRAANHLALSSLGYEAKEINKKTVLEVMPSLSLLAWKKLWKEMKNDNILERKTEFITKEDIIFPVSATLQLIEIGNKRYCCFLIENLLERNRYKDLLDLISKIGGIGSWEVDFIQGKLTLTEETYNLADLPRPEEDLTIHVLFKWLRKCLSREDFTQLIALSRSSAKTGQDFEMELSLSHLKKRFLVVGVSQVLEDSTSKLYGTLQDISNISARSDEMYMAQFTLDHAFEMIFWIEKDGRLNFVNESACKQLGYSKKKLLQMKLVDIMPELPLEAWENHWTFLRKQQTLEIETLQQTEDGRLIPVFASLNFIKFQGEEYSCAFVRNLSVKKSRDELIYLAHHTLNQTNDLIFWVQPDGSFLYFNETAYQKLGYTREELKQCSIFDIHPDIDPESFQQIWITLAEQKMEEKENRALRKNGSFFPVEQTLSFINFQEIQCICLTLRDITIRKEKAAELQKATDQILKLKNKLEEERTYLQEEVSSQHNFNHIISKSANYKRVMQQIAQVADTDSTVLILGETGTGKELLARAAHSLSSRSNRALIKVNCAALPENLIESELFGHEKGAFTGAYQSRKGRFELADQGTIFLDEIGEFPIELQSKILRVLQEGEFERLGSMITQKVDVRVIAATNRNLEQQVEKGRFREDLYYRLNVFPIYNIPLRERKDDIAPLVQHFVNKYNERAGKEISKIPEAAVRRLHAYEFPGNIRELENLIERAVILSSGDTLNLDAVFPELNRKKERQQKKFLTLEELQRKHIIDALRRTNWKVTGKRSASEILGMNGKTLASRMRKFGIKREDFIDI